ncbi:26186_t:CDS:2, partial [Gigaspora margarita]
MLKEKEVQKAELEKLDKEIKLQESLGQELKELGNIREAKLRGQKNQREALNSLRTAMYNACLDFYLNTQEIQKGTRYNGSPVPRSGMAMKTFYKAVGSQFVNTTQLRQIIDREVQTTDYLDNRAGKRPNKAQKINHPMLNL